MPKGKQAVHVNLRNRISQAGSKEDLQVNSQGAYFRLGDKHYLEYQEEVADQGPAQVRVKVDLKAGRALIQRKTADAAMRLPLVPGQAVPSHYQVGPYRIPMTVELKSLSHDLAADKGSLRLVYEISDLDDQPIRHELKLHYHAEIV
ncbi:MULTISPECIES: DUF1934 domain-containing protein [Aerococcus]|uniref:DUF1934 domain-containing protein n=1 Tax=Aerococcus sanguinicola TaxID=119206 RepID=A0A5N1GI57_9LACT|nr:MULTISPECIES: DUF1934 domain-containing protein [Aerococcus]KAA9300603.1 DUF1934 domain-containing protein [Aerococcus sanguinicola]MDK6369595.1 DUF1934 domain-containing protein [Aerococcus sp. UMB9870]MDK6680100.1 DUF1934 domain-containing protein [Aerococcus sp. UMB8608]MDK6686261.1 DUF1934 domain-containing protein [Aerococcus sp. UMB8623]MDK6940180.1 DUF1934 domain-containing protein [Aerococcus sp. UMB8487]